jgi:hypothetical protein
MIDFEDLLQNVREEHTHMGSRGTSSSSSSYRVLYTSGCTLCEILFQDAAPNAAFRATEVELRSYSFVKNSHWFHWYDWVPLGLTDSVLLILGTMYWDSFNPLADPGDRREVFCKRIVADSEDTCVVRHVQNTWQPQMTKAWLQHCMSHHGNNCQVDAPTCSVPGMNLIDCECNIIIEVTPDMPWLALSYVWGSDQGSDAPQVIVGFSAGSHLPPTTAKTVQDAIIVARELGYRYLWVDE